MNELSKGLQMAIDNSVQSVSEYGAPVSNSSPSHIGSSERRLLLAILERAILDFVGNNSTESYHASKWLFENDLSNNMNLGNTDVLREFSFLWICHHLDLNAKHISNLIKNMPKRGKHRIAPWYFTRKKDKKAQILKFKKLTLHKTNKPSTKDQEARYSTLKVNTLKCKALSYSEPLTALG